MVFVKNDIEWTCDGYSTVKYLYDKFGLVKNAADYVPEAVLYPAYFVDRCADGVDRVRIRCFIKNKDSFENFGLLTDGKDKHTSYMSSIRTLQDNQKIEDLYEHRF